MTVEPLERSLFDVEDTSVMPNVRDMVVAPASTSDVREFARRYHYSRTEGSALWRWGLWHGPVLLGVVAYNIPTRRACSAVFGQDYADHVIHMGRLVLADLAPRNSESRLIGGSLKVMQKTMPDVWAVLTYAATDMGHIGTVYQATNAFYTGTGGKEIYYRDSDGILRNPHVANSTITRTAAEERGWTRFQGGPKHRYVYILGNKTQRRQRRELLKFPVLPYPKHNTQ